ncbi:MAG TPA: phosphatidate cytidylyltransferase [Candidatus Ozemobacteraceae bacterium]|nr:phosphatidate cytidylyltransferase [Candidatus Ozemobacteraceae bacterium]
MISRLPLILIGIPLVYGVLSAGPWPRCLMLATIALIGQWELFTMFGPAESKPKYIFEYISGFALLAAATLWGERGLLFGVSLATAGYAIATVTRGLDGRGWQRFALATAGLLYLPFCLSFFQLIAEKAGATAVFSLLVVVWVLDIGAYLFGMSFRRFWDARLAPRISPNKTIVGAIGGTMVCLAAVWGLAQIRWMPLSGIRLWVFALCAALVGQTTDLFESVLKRDAGIKDSSALLGAHGGMLDRIDSVLFLGPLAYLFLIV